MSNRYNITLYSLTPDKAMEVIEMAARAGIKYLRETAAEARRSEANGTHGIVLDLIADGPKHLGEVKTAFKKRGYATTSAASVLSNMRKRGAVLYAKRIVRLP